MKRLLKLLVFILPLLGVLVIFSGCKKEENNSKTETLFRLAGVYCIHHNVNGTTEKYNENGTIEVTVIRKDGITVPEFTVTPLGGDSVILNGESMTDSATQTEIIYVDYKGGYDAGGYQIFVDLGILDKSETAEEGFSWYSGTIQNTTGNMLNTAGNVMLLPVESGEIKSYQGKYTSFGETEVFGYWMAVSSGSNVIGFFMPMSGYWGFSFTGLQTGIQIQGCTLYDNLPVSAATDGDGISGIVFENGNEKWSFTGTNVVNYSPGDDPGNPAANHAPVISSVSMVKYLNYDINGNYMGGTFNYSAIASDPDGDSLTYTWELNDDHAEIAASGSTAIVTADSFGSGNVTLTVTDEHGESAVCNSEYYGQ